MTKSTRATTLEIKLHLWLKAPPQRVWKALTQDRALKRWYARPWKHQLKKSGAWGFLDGRSSGKVLKLKRARLLVHSQKDAPEFPDTHIAYALTPFGKDTHLIVTHSNFGRNRMVHDCWTAAWPFILCNLKTFVETGAPLREGSFQ